MEEIDDDYCAGALVAAGLNKCTKGSLSSVLQRLRRRNRPKVELEEGPGILRKVEGVQVNSGRSYRKQGVFTSIVDGDDYRVVWRVNKKGMQIESDLSEEQLSRVFAFLVQEASSEL